MLIICILTRHQLDKYGKFPFISSILNLEQKVLYFLFSKHSQKVTLQKINFVLKFGLASFFFAFALWYNSVLYNSIIASILVIVLIKERMSLFKFPGQRFIFSLFLFMIFLFQSLSGYGKILINLPLNLTVTEEAVMTAITFVTQILLIFLLFGIAIYSSQKIEIFYYFEKIEGLGGPRGQSLERFLRIGMFAFYMLPRSLKVRDQISEKIRMDSKVHAGGITERVKIILDHIYNFVFAIIKSTEREYPEFIIQRNNISTFSPKPVLTLQSGMILFSVLFIHGMLIWQHY
jgi:hypothetical protein